MLEIHIKECKVRQNINQDFSFLIKKEIHSGSFSLYHNMEVDILERSRQLWSAVSYPLCYTRQMRVKSTSHRRGWNCHWMQHCRKQPFFWIFSILINLVLPKQLKVLRISILICSKDGHILMCVELASYNYTILLNLKFNKLSCCANKGCMAFKGKLGERWRRLWQCGGHRGHPKVRGHPKYVFKLP